MKCVTCNDFILIKKSKWARHGDWAPSARSGPQGGLQQEGTQSCQGSARGVWAELEDNGIFPGCCHQIQVRQSSSDPESALGYGTFALLSPSPLLSDEDGRDEPKPMLWLCREVWTDTKEHLPPCPISTRFDSLRLEIPPATSWAVLGAGKSIPDPAPSNLLQF